MVTDEMHGHGLTGCTGVVVISEEALTFGLKPTSSPTLHGDVVALPGFPLVLGAAEAFTGATGGQCGSRHQL